MSDDQIFEMAVNACKAQSFDYMAAECAKAHTEIIRLKKIIDTHLTDCETCEGDGKIRHSAVYVGGDLYQDSEVMDCEDCKGTGKICK